MRILVDRQGASQKRPRLQWWGRGGLARLVTTARRSLPSKSAFVKVTMIKQQMLAIHALYTGLLRPLCDQPISLIQ